MNISSIKEKFEKVLPEKEMFCSVKRDYIFSGGSVKDFLSTEINGLLSDIEKWAEEKLCLLGQTDNPKNAVEILRLKREEMPYASAFTLQEVLDFISKLKQ